ncbi:hypothetical protein MMC25_005750 [Agyrium rufum]|nr:hypothetical protein [Agyrium rufum]
MDYTQTQNYDYHVPSPPLIQNAIPEFKTMNEKIPSIDSTGRANLSASTLSALPFLPSINHNCILNPYSPIGWRYEDRRHAQAVLPYLYLGPSSVARDATFLREQGITLLLDVRADSRMQGVGSKSKGGAGDLGIASQRIVVRGEMGLIAAFGEAVGVINSHLCEQYHYLRRQAALQQQRQQEEGSSEQLSTMPGTSESSEQVQPQQVTGKVLVYCETGNESSAAVVVAYLMAVYEASLDGAMAVVTKQRFCTVLLPEVKQMLRSYEEILNATRDVTRLKGIAESECADHNGGKLAAFAGHVDRNEKENVAAGQRALLRNASKRGFEMDSEADLPGDPGYGDFDGDRERFEGRAKWAPFVGR